MLKEVRLCCKIKATIFSSVFQDTDHLSLGSLCYGTLWRNTELAITYALLLSPNIYPKCKCDIHLHSFNVKKSCIDSKNSVNEIYPPMCFYCTSSCFLGVLYFNPLALLSLLIEVCTIALVYPLPLSLACWVRFTR